MTHCTSRFDFVGGTPRCTPRRTLLRHVWRNRYQEVTPEDKQLAKGNDGKKLAAKVKYPDFGDKFVDQ